MVASFSLFRVLLVFSLTGFVSGAFAAEPQHGEVANLLKAAYLYKFVDYVEWPLSASIKADDRVVIGVMDADDVAAALATLIAEHPGARRPMVIKMVKSGDSFNDIQVLYIGQKDGGQLKNLLVSARELPMLTVTACDNALEYGSIINFVVVDGRVKFEISVRQADRSGLKISSRLLGIAQKIDGGSR